VDEFPQVVFQDVPWIPFEERVQVNDGFINTPAPPRALDRCQAQGLPVNLF